MSTFGKLPKSEAGSYAPRMSLAEVLDDLLNLQELAEVEGDPKRRRALDEVRSHVARRERGAKVSEAAAVLAISQPTVRAWIELRVLTPMPGTKPVRLGRQESAPRTRPPNGCRAWCRSPGSLPTAVRQGVRRSFFGRSCCPGSMSTTSASTPPLRRQCTPGCTPDRVSYRRSSTGRPPSSARPVPSAATQPALSQLLPGEASWGSPTCCCTR